jgi:hypothetical protein
MFKKLKEKWGVSSIQFWIIFIAFACTGTTTAYITIQIHEWLHITSETWWLWRFLLKIAILLFGYQIILLFFGALLGQWKFFWNYEKKLLKWFGKKLGLYKKKSD